MDPNANSYRQPEMEKLDRTAFAKSHNIFIAKFLEYFNPLESQTELKKNQENFAFADCTDERIVVARLLNDGNPGARGN